MSREEHHMLCLGVLAKLYIQAHLHQEENSDEFTDIPVDDLNAIEQAVESAAKRFNYPVSVERLREMKHICTTGLN